MLPSWLDRLQRATLIATAFLFSAGYATVGLLVLLGTVLAQGVVERRVPWHRSSLDLPLLAFVLVFFISGWASEFRAVAIATTGVAALTLYLSIGPLYRILRRDREFLRPFLLIWWIGGVIAAIWTVALHWLTDRPAYLPALGQNAVGTTLMVALVLGMGLFAVTKSAYGYLIGAGSLVVGLGLAQTYTRGAWVGAFIALVGFFVLAGLRRARRTLLLLLLVITAGIVVSGTERASFLLRARAIFSPEANLHRIFLAKTAGAIFLDHPMLGTGLNTFPLIRPRYVFPGDPYPEGLPNAHNMFLNMAAEGGLLGLITFTALILTSLAAGWRWYIRARPRPESVLSATILSAFLGMIVHQFFDGTAFSVHLGAGMWFLATILLSLKPFRIQARPPTPKHG